MGRQGTISAMPGPSSDTPHSIEVKLREISQLFNSMDPSPFHARDLDDDAEQFIVGSAEEFALDAPVILRLRLERTPDNLNATQIEGAVHNYFAYRAEMNRMAFRSLMQQGRASLLIGLVFLTVCLGVSRFFFAGDSTWDALLREGLMGVGWVAMWRPIEIYLYDWWPLRRKGRIYSKLSRMPVEIIQP